MALSEALIKKLSQKYPANELTDLRYRGNDLTVKANETGHAILLFIGQRQEGGHIRGERYARRLLFDDAGNTLKDHWELKGKSI
jgi:hypothetical protein